MVMFVLVPLARAQDDERKDAEGCKDSPLITRFPGSIINSCENKEFDQFDFPLGNDKDGNAQTKHIEGEFHSWDIGTREGTSELQVYRNMETALKSAGFQIDHTESPCNLTAHKGGTWIYIESKGTYYYQTIVSSKEMKQEVTADASSLKDEIEKTGHGLRHPLRHWQSHHSAGFRRSLKLGCCFAAASAGSEIAIGRTYRQSISFLVRNERKQSWLG
jgi:hypothetical protein